MYLEKALQVPSDKVQQKLLQATQVIIQLVKEREDWKIKEEELTRQISQLQESLSKQDIDCDNSDTDDSWAAMEENNVATTNERPGDIPQCNKVVPMKMESFGINRPKNDPTTMTQLNQQQQPLQDLTNLYKQNTQSAKNPLENAPTGQDHNLSLSPLKFSDTSYYSGLEILQKALADDDQKSSTPLLSERQHHDDAEELIVEGKKVTQNKGNMHVNKKVNYIAPRPQRSTKLKIRNYNIKDD